MNKTKVIIITRSNAYIEYYDNGWKESKEDRKEYGNPIIDELDMKTNFSIGKAAVKTFLTARDQIHKEWNPEEYPGLSTFFEQKYGINGLFQYADGSNDYMRIEAEGIKEMIENNSVNVPKEFLNKRCYVHFTKEDIDSEIILLLWDVLYPEEDKKIEPFGLFIEKLCEDCGVNNDQLNILYVHDNQFGNDSDETILNNFDNNIHGKYKNQLYYATLTKYFKYVATFRHMADNGIFQDYILKFQFGPTLAETIAAIELNATSFLLTRNASDEVIAEVINNQN